MEKAGIPTVDMIYADQANFYQNIALMNGCPNIRWVVAPRIGTPSEMVATYYDKVIKALTDPLTAKEKETGIYSPPAPPRVLFEGTTDEAQNFLQQTILVENCRMCPIAKYTDGLPVIIPTEEKVAEMLTGTSHKPNEVLTNPLATATATAFSRQIAFARNYTSTVEKVAICAVMAGCQPQYLPACLAIACGGGNTTSCPGTSGRSPSVWLLSGPYAKEIGMNAGQNSMDVGNRANMTLGRVGALIDINFGQCITGIGRTDQGNLLHSICFPEDLEGLPPGWVSFAQECTYYDPNTKTNVKYTADQSVMGRIGGRYAVTGLLTYPGYFRTLNAGEGGIARKLGVEGVPGHYNWLPYVCTELMMANIEPTGTGFCMDKNLAELLYEAGFQSKTEIYKWLWDNYFVTIEQWYNTGRWEFSVAGPTGVESAIEPTSGLTYGELRKTAPDYKLHFYGANDYMRNFVVVSDSFADEGWWFFNSGRPTAQPIDPWR
jgi:hypothetical protein